jgi:hypothetical protein
VKSAVVTFERRWHVEVTVDGFGPAHPLWGRFVHAAKPQWDDRLAWNLAESTRSRPAGRIQATVTAVTPEEAVRRLMKAVREVGQSVDRTRMLSWSGLTGRAQLAQ